MIKHHAIKTEGRSGAMAQRVFNVGTGQDVSGKRHALAALATAKESPVW
jgi:hypothetical protein